MPVPALKQPTGKPDENSRDKHPRIKEPTIWIHTKYKHCETTDKHRTDYDCGNYLPQFKAEQEFHVSTSHNPKRGHQKY